ncbi:Splicing factor, suppressor of white-apricot -like protein [Takifugu flavidus]|uniref:Splicing factor, suppressor of white-apricot-like protein n=1 Tax=Takifugu flavidus TaxID=433684 RepID=A0A5C6MF78_9TELE|nr:Splicing factor, suppressor of white-apricot -like protein [Takifugu flavidus]
MVPSSPATEEEYKRLSECLADEGSYNAVAFKYTADYYDPSKPTEEEEASRHAGGGGGGQQVRRRRGGRRRPAGEGGGRRRPAGEEEERGEEAASRPAGEGGRRRPAGGGGGGGQQVGGRRRPAEEAEPEVNEEPFVAPPGLAVPADVELPATVKTHNIIERTANFVCQQGAQFEIVLKAKQARNSQFDFLRFDHYLNPYYKHILRAMKEGRYKLASDSQQQPQGEWGQGPPGVGPGATGGWVGPGAPGVGPGATGGGARGHRGLGGARGHRGWGQGSPGPGVTGGGARGTGGGARGHRGLGPGVTGGWGQGSPGVGPGVTGGWVGPGVGPGVTGGWGQGHQVSARASPVFPTPAGDSQSDDSDDDGDGSYLHPSLFAPQKSSRLEELVKVRTVFQPLKVMDPDHPLAALVQKARQERSGVAAVVPQPAGAVDPAASPHQPSTLVTVSVDLGRSSVLCCHGCRVELVLLTWEGSLSAVRF